MNRTRAADRHVLTPSAAAPLSRAAASLGSMDAFEPRTSSRLCWFTLALLCASGLIFPPATFGQDRGPLRISSDVRARAAQGRAVRVIVGVRADVQMEGRLRAPQISSQRDAIRARLDEVIGRLGSIDTRRTRRFRTIPFFAAEVGPVALRQLELDPDVTSIEEDVAEAPTLAQSVPLVGAPQAWASGHTGSGWAVAILDTGVDSSHPMMAGKVVSEACYSNAGGAGDGLPLCPDRSTATTAPGSGASCSSTLAGCWHGTHVAGIAAGRSPALSGVARDATVISVQVFTSFPGNSASCGGAPCILSYVSDQILGLERVLALRATLDIAAVNLSLGGSQKFTDTASCDAAHGARKAAIDNLRSAGIATVIASGNDGYVDGLVAPACISSAISVGSSTKADGVSSFTNAAPFLALLAPGDAISSSVPGGGVAAISGTSMAAPHVAGAWTLLKARKPSADISEILGALRSSGDPIVDSGNSLTFRRLRVDRAVLSLSSRAAMALDSPRAGEVAPSFTVAGWAIDEAAPSGSGIDAVHVYAVPEGGGGATFLGVASHGGTRTDVAAVYGSRFTDSAFHLSVTGLAPGTYQVVAYAHSAATGAFEISAAARVTVAPPASRPASNIDQPAVNAVVPPSFAVTGWALDLNATASSGVDAVHVYAYRAGTAAPLFLGAASVGLSRPDVASAFGHRFETSGFRVPVNDLPPGSYTLVVYARSTVSGAFSASTRTVTVRPAGNPLMTIDTPRAGTVDGAFLIAGWAIDLDAVQGPGIDAVHIWAYRDNGPPVWLGAAELGFRRPDVGVAYGPAFTDSGYNLAVPGGALDPGNYRLVVFSRSAVAGAFSLAHAVDVTVR